MALKEKYWDHKTTARTLPSIVCLKNFRSSQSNKLRTVSDWEDLSTSLDEYVGQIPTNQVHPSTHPVRTVVQSIPLARPKMTQQTGQAPATTHTTSVQTLKMTILYVTSVFKLTKPDSVKPNKLTTWCSIETDASLAKTRLTASDAPHLSTKALIQKLDEVAKTVDLDVSTILEEQRKDPVFGTLRSWIRINTPLDTKPPEIQQSKGLPR